MAAADAIHAKAFTQQQRSDVVEGSADWIVLEALKKFEFTHSEVCAADCSRHGHIEKRVF
jgi:hypothetical protein